MARRLPTRLLRRGWKNLRKSCRDADVQARLVIEGELMRRGKRFE